MERAKCPGRETCNVYRGNTRHWDRQRSKNEPEVIKIESSPGVSQYTNPSFFFFFGASVEKAKTTREICIIKKIEYAQRRSGSKTPNKQKKNAATRSRRLLLSHKKRGKAKENAANHPKNKLNQADLYSRTC